MKMDMSMESMDHDEKRFTEDPGAMMLEHPSMYAWVQPVIMILAVWLITSPLIFQYNSVPLVVSDIVSGLLMFAIATIALFIPRFSWITYANAIVGLWLILAPLFFWAPSAAVYATDTIIGTFLIAFSFVFPMSMKMPGPDIPPGWSYNPSTWVQRTPIIVLGLIGFFLSRPMAAYQLGHIESVWEPFFSPGTEAVLNSEISKMFPVSDAGLGAAAYLIEVLSTFMGDERRWRTMPWMVAIFGLAVVPLGVTSIILVMMQPLAVGTWCTLCLIAAAAMLIMVPFALDEVVAMIQFLNHSHKQGKSVWRTFWHGGSLEDATDIPRADRKPTWKLQPATWGIANHLGLLACSGIGIWLMFAPTIFGMNGLASDNSHLVGALILTVSVICLSEVARPARFLNVIFAVWLIASPWLLAGDTPASHWALLFSGLILAPLSWPRGQIRDQYGTYNPWVSWNPFSIRGTKEVIRTAGPKRKAMKNQMA